MSLYIIHCDGCGSSEIQITLKLETEISSCPCCHDLKTQDSSVYFCSHSCMFNWMNINEVAEKGFPCPHCKDHSTGKSTGFASGYEANGKCGLCDGTGRFTKRKRRDIEFDAERVALQMAYTKEIEAAGGYDAYVEKKVNAQRAKDDDKFEFDGGYLD